MIPVKSKKIDILGVGVSETTLHLACRELGQWIEKRTKAYVCVVPVSTIVECQQDSQFRKIVNNASMCTPDGMPVVWLAKASGSRIIQRTYGPDLMLALCRFGQDKGFRHFFYGGTEDSNQKLLARLTKDFPDIQIAGCYSPPFQPVGAKETAEVITRINQARPDVLWVGLGSPKQDYWMVNHQTALDVPVMIGVGAAFDFISGVKKQAPKWIRHSGFEWLFRLCCEPRRLWRRYLVGNTKFIYYLLKSVFTRFAVRIKK